MEKIKLYKENLTLQQLEQFEERFIDYLDVDNLTLQAYKVGIKAFMKYLKDNSINNPTRESVIAFRNYLRDNYSSCTINTYMTSVKALFKYLNLKGLYENIAQDIKGAKYSNTPKKQILTLEQCKYIYNSLTDKREKALFSLMITTGLRGIEVSRAKIEDIKLHNGEMVLWVQCKKHDAKDEYVKLSEQVINDLKDYLESRTKGYIFVSESNNNKGGGVTTTTLRREIKNIFKRFGLDSDTFSLHSLRRTCGTIMYEQNNDIYKVQQVLHHKSSSTTQRYINAITRNNNEGEYQVANAIFG